MARSGSYTYDPTTGKWSQNTEVSTAPEKSTKDIASTSSGDNLIASSTDKDSATGDAEKKYNTIEYNYLSGTLEFIVTNSTIKLKAGDTVTLNGIGNFLSGNYYVQDVTRKISKSSGYSHSATLLKTDFGTSLKSVTTTPPAENPPVEKPVEQRTYVLKKGDCLWKVAQMYYGNGALYQKIADANGISPSQYRRLPIGLKVIVP